MKSGRSREINLLQKVKSGRNRNGGVVLKKVWIGLSVACVLIGVLGTIEDVMSGTPFEEAAVLLFFFGLLAALFAWLALAIKAHGGADWSNSGYGEGEQ